MSHYDKGVILYQQRRFDLAEAEFRKALSENPQAPYSHAMLAAALSAQGHSERAVKEAQLAIKLDPEIAYSHYILSLSQLATGRNKDAEKSTVTDISQSCRRNCTVCRRLQAGS